MNLLHRIFFPGIPYPGAAIWHIILGSGLTVLIAYLLGQYNGYGYTLPLIGSVVGLVLGYVVFKLYPGKG